MADDPHAASRTYDADLMRGAYGSREGRQATAVVDAAGSAAVTGIEKLAQRALLELLTRRGSMAALPSRGSSLLDAASSGLIRTEADVFQRFAFAAVDVTRNLRADERDSDPPDERLAAFELERASVSAGTLVLGVRIESAAGTGVVVPAVLRTVP